MTNPLLRTAIAKKFEFGIDYRRFLRTVGCESDADSIMEKYGEDLMRTAELLGMPYHIRWKDNELAISPQLLKKFEEYIMTHKHSVVIANEIITG